MPFTLQVRFEGLIGFVPLSGEDDSSSMVAVLVDAREARQASDGTHLHSHFPVVRFKKSDLKEGILPKLPEDETSQVLYFLSETGDNPDGYWFLDRQELEIRYDGQKTPLRIWSEEAAPSNGFFAGKTEREFFSHVPQIGAFVDPAFLVPQPRSGVVVARLRMSEGVIQSTGLEQDSDGHDIEIDLRPLGSSESKLTKGRVVSSGVLWSVQIPNESVTWYSTSFKSGTATPIMTLKPGGAENVVRVRVQNLPLEDILGLGKGHAKATIDRHFEMFYELCAQRPPLRKTPIPHVRMNGAAAAPAAGGHAHGDTAVPPPGPIRITDLACPPATFLG